MLLNAKPIARGIKGDLSPITTRKLILPKISEFRRGLQNLRWHYNLVDTFISAW